MQRKTSRPRALVLLGAVVCAAAINPVYAVDSVSAAHHTSRSCAVANGVSGMSSSATSASAASGSPTPAAGSVREPNPAGPATPSSGRMSSNVTTGPNGLIGTTTMPDGSTVTVAPGQAGSRTSATSNASSDSSASASASSASSKSNASNVNGAVPDKDCIDTDTRSNPTSEKKHQNGKQPKSQKENR